MSMSRPKRILLGVVVVLLIVLGPYIWSRIASPGRRIRVHNSTKSVPANQETESRALRVACYNIAHGRGLNRDNWIDETKVERTRRLDEIAALLSELDADIVALNEVDFACSWSQGVNQAACLAEKSRLPSLRRRTKSRLPRPQPHVEIRQRDSLEVSHRPS